MLKLEFPKEQIKTFSLPNQNIRYFNNEMDECLSFFVKDIFEYMDLGRYSFDMYLSYLNSSPVDSSISYWRHDHFDFSIITTNSIGLTLSAFFARSIIENLINTNNYTESVYRDLCEININILALHNTYPELDIPSIMAASAIGFNKTFYRSKIDSCKAWKLFELANGILKRIVPFAEDYHDNNQPKSYWKKIFAGKPKMY